MTIVLVDLDGVMADFDLTLWERTREHWPADYHPDQQAHRFCTDLLRGAARKAVRAETYKPGFFASLAPIPGAVDGVRELAAMDGVDVWFCSKPLYGNPTCHSDKAAWLEQHLGAEWSRRLILAADKSMVFGDILLDDAPRLEWLELGEAPWEPVVFTRPWNGPGSDWGHIPRWSWGDPWDRLLGEAL